MKTFSLIILVAVIIFGIFLFTKGEPSVSNVATPNNVTIIDGKQIVEIKAKGGFTPRKSVAKAGLPTILRFNTESTFDCSSSVRIPDLNISKNLPLSGVTDVEILSNQIGILKGSCGMGMYPFEVEFRI